MTAPRSLPALPALLAILVAGCAGKGTINLPGDTVGTDSGADSASHDSGDSADTADSGDTADSSDTADSGDADTAPSFAPVSDVTVSVNPNVVTVLQVSWTQLEDADATWLEWTFEDDTWSSSPELARAAGPASEVILGVPADTVVTLRIVERIGDRTLTSEETFTGTTGTLPADLPAVTVNTYDESLASTEPYMLGSLDVSDNWYYGPFWVFILDRKGRYVWYAEEPDSRLSLFAQVSGDGTHLVWEGCTYYVFDGSIAPTVTRMTLDQSWTSTLTVPSFGFGFEEIDDGTFFYESVGREQELVEHSPDGTERVIWSCDDYLRAMGASPSTCMPNSIVYHAETDSILWSMFMNDTVVEIDRTTGEVLRQFGQLSGGYDFDPTDSVNDYQHYPSYTPDGTLILSTHIKDAPGQQRAREYSIDDDAGLMTEVWEYGEGVTDRYAQYGGEAIRLSNENTLISYGTMGFVREVTYDKEVAWEITWPDRPRTHLEGHNTLLNDLYAINAGPADRSVAYE